MRFGGAVGTCWKAWLAVMVVVALCASAMAGVGVPTASAQNQAGDASFVYVANETVDGAGKYNVSVVDPVSGTIVANVAVGPGPKWIAVTPDGSKVYVADSFDSSVSVIATATNTVIATVPVGLAPTGVAVSPDGSQVYVTDSRDGAGSVSVIATATDTVIATIPLRTFSPQVVAFSPDGSTAWVASSSGEPSFTGTVSKINTATRAVTNITVGGTPQGVAVSPDGGKVYVTNRDGRVSVISATTDAVIATIPVQSTPIGVAVSPGDCDRAYVANSGSATVSVIDTETDAVIATIPVQGTPTGVAVSADCSTVYVTNYGGKTLSVIDAATNTVLRNIPGFFSPYGVTPAPSLVETPPADVQIVKTAPETVPQGGTISYTLDVVNHGPGPAADVTVTDVLNDDLTDISVPPDCELAGRTVTCPVGLLDANEGRSFTITARVPFAVPVDAQIENCGTASSSTPEVTETGKESCTASTVVPDPADITVTKAGPDRVLPGDTVTYTITITNDGPDHADDTDVTDVFPGELTDIVVPSDCTLTSRTLGCDIGTLAADATSTFTVTATVGPDTAAGTEIENCATGTTATPETVYTNNTSCVQTLVGTGAEPPATDVVIAKSGPATVTQGGAASYLLTVTNHSSVDAEDTVVSDVFPGTLTVTGVPAGCELAEATLSCDIGTLAAGASLTFTVPVTVAAQAAAGFDIENCATVTTTSPDSDLADNGSCNASRVEQVPDTDVAITKSGPVAAAGGEEISYTLRVTDYGIADAEDTVVSDVFSGPVTVIAIPSGCTLATKTLACEIGTLPDGATRTFAVTVMVPYAPDGSAIENCATVYTTTTETDLANNASCVQTVVSAPEVPVTG